MNAKPNPRVQAAMSDAGQSTPPEASPAKRSKPVPSPETEAIRAVRELRKLRERADAAHRTYQETRNACVEASVKVENGLSAAAWNIVKKLAPELLAAEAKLNGGGT